MFHGMERENTEADLQVICISVVAKAVYTMIAIDMLKIRTKWTGDNMKYAGEEITTKDIEELYCRINSLENALLVERARAILTFDSSIRQDMYDNWRGVDDEVKDEQLDQARRELELEGTIRSVEEYGEFQVFDNGKWVVH